VAHDFFARLAAETPTRIWVNNPTPEEIGLALAQGAVGSTTNPAYGGGLLKRAPELVRDVIAEVVREEPDDRRAAALVQRRLVARIAQRFREVHEASGRRHGFVSIQSDPEADHEAASILADGRAGREIGPNATPKIPATVAGLEAFEALVAEGSPTIITEVFSIAQFVAACERYVAITDRTNVRPPFFLSPITGIFGDHLKRVAARDGSDASASELELVGVAVARACLALGKARNYPVTLLCGGSRVPFDLVGLVGADVHVTINWSTFAEVLNDDVPFEVGFDRPIPDAVIERLGRSFPDVRRALDPAGLVPEEFEDFGPVRHFHDAFVAGWQAVATGIRDARRELVGTP
jgi:transaldolase